ncbi:hypothetical protein ABIA33_003604 [Streptacidiphilus sp. MAP12-16]|uniref:hypothetical protein n=1 Tax=Streptacidiphilus sp. MAP12-16 TaxID=3156300 RepID=UPI00351353E4
MSEQTETTGGSSATPAAPEPSIVPEQKPAATSAAPVPTVTPVPATAVPIDPAAVWAVPPNLAPPVRRKRPWVRTTLRWTTAVVVCAAVGTGTAFGVMAPRRTDVPGLKTPADARYAFPALKLPRLPSNAANQTATGSMVHLADLRQLLLPAPAGAQPDPKFPGLHGWYPLAAYTAQFGNGTVLSGKLTENGIRHIAATAWTMPDGTRTEIYLLGFRSDRSASSIYNYDSVSTLPSSAPGAITDLGGAAYSGVDSSYLTVKAQAGGGLDKAVRFDFLSEGDVEAVIVMTNPKAVPVVANEQVAVLQHELLQD